MHCNVCKSKIGVEFSFLFEFLKIESLVISSFAKEEKKKRRNMKSIGMGRCTLRKKFIRSSIWKTKETRNLYTGLYLRSSFSMKLDVRHFERSIFNVTDVILDRWNWRGTSVSCNTSPWNLRSHVSCFSLRPMIRK